MKKTDTNDVVTFTLFVVIVVLVLRALFFDTNSRKISQAISMLLRDMPRACAAVDVLASKGLVSMTPMIVSAGPTISSSSSVRVLLAPELLLLLLPTLVLLVEIKVVDTEIWLLMRCMRNSSTKLSTYPESLIVCGGTGGALTLGKTFVTSPRATAMLSKLLLVCGMLIFCMAPLINSFELLVTVVTVAMLEVVFSALGDDFLGGSGGAPIPPFASFFCPSFSVVIRACDS
uniref:Uncharacterized protein n=1 Tax=Glossina brevipalpis TaxID=37001 RepID=A0A1A9WFI8_9MUSC